MFDKKFFGQRLRAIRLATNTSQLSLANYLKVAKSTISMIESGQRAVSIEVLCAIADYFDVTIDYLIGRSCDDTPVSFHSDWEDRFRENLSNLLPSLDRTDLYDVYIDVSDLESIADGETPLTLHRACDIADQLGISLDYLMGRTENQDLNI